MMINVILMKKQIFSSGIHILVVHIILLRVQDKKPLKLNVVLTFKDILRLMLELMIVILMIGSFQIYFQLMSQLKALHVNIAVPVHLVISANFVVLVQIVVLVK